MERCFAGDRLRTKGPIKHRSFRNNEAVSNPSIPTVSPCLNWDSTSHEAAHGSPRLSLVLLSKLECRRASDANLLALL